VVLVLSAGSFGKLEMMLVLIENIQMTLQM
jgi:hypothetical protein